MDGWLKLHRSLADHWLFDFKEPDKALAWIDLLIMARHTEGQVKLKGRVQIVKRSQVAMSQLSLQKRWKWSQNKVKRFLNLLKKHGMADFETNDLTTIITICNFDSYQADERTGERPNGRPDGRPVERYADDQSNDDIRKKESKERENGKKQQAPSGAKQAVDFSLFNATDDQIAEIKRIRRQNKGGSITQRVVNGLAKEFAQAQTMGYSFDELLTEWEVRGWKSFKAEWVKPKTSGSQLPSAQTFESGRF
jgi:hypothetical protein